MPHFSVALRGIGLRNNYDITCNIELEVIGCSLTIVHGWPTLVQLIGFYLWLTMFILHVMSPLLYKCKHSSSVYTIITTEDG